MNIDQGTRFIPSAVIDVLRRNAIRTRMDGKGCRRDSVFVERLWKSVKYAHVCPHACEITPGARTEPAADLDFREADSDRLPIRGAVHPRVHTS